MLDFLSAVDVSLVGFVDFGVKDCGFVVVGLHALVFLLLFAKELVLESLGVVAALHLVLFVQVAVESTPAAPLPASVAAEEVHVAVVEAVAVVVVLVEVAFAAVVPEICP